MFEDSNDSLPKERGLSDSEDNSKDLDNEIDFDSDDDIVRCAKFPTSKCQKMTD